MEKEKKKREYVERKWVHEFADRVPMDIGYAGAMALRQELKAKIIARNEAKGGKKLKLSSTRFVMLKSKESKKYYHAYVSIYYDDPMIKVVSEERRIVQRYPLAEADLADLESAKTEAVEDFKFSTILRELKLYEETIDVEFNEKRKNKNAEFVISAIVIEKEIYELNAGIEVWEAYDKNGYYATIHVSSSIRNNEKNKKKGNKEVLRQVKSRCQQIKPCKNPDELTYKYIMTLDKII